MSGQLTLLSVLLLLISTVIGQPAKTQQKTEEIQPVDADYGIPDDSYYFIQQNDPSVRNMEKRWANQVRFGKRASWASSVRFG